MRAHLMIAGSLDDWQDYADTAETRLEWVRHEIGQEPSMPKCAVLDVIEAHKDDCESVVVTVLVECDDCDALSDWCDDTGGYFEFASRVYPDPPSPVWPANLGHGELSEVQPRN